MLDRVRDVLALAAAGAVSCALGATVGFTSLWLAGVVPLGALWSVWSTWWLGDIGGVLIVAPLLLVLAAWRRQDAHSRLEHKVRERTAALAIANAHLLTLATRDSLTGLPNRMLFFDLLDRAIALARRQRWEVAILFVDVDGFKHTNDAYGHHVGDELLIETAQRLQLAVRASDVVARLGGDEFAILLTGSTAAEEAASMAGRVLERLAQPSRVAAAPPPSASIGIAGGRADDALCPRELLRQADAAMYHAKAEGGGRYALFAPAMSTPRTFTPRVHAV